MKARKILAAMLVFVMLACITATSAITAFAFNTPNDIKSVALTIAEPKAGEAVNVSTASVTVDAPMDYKVTGVNWFKDYETDYQNDRLCTGSNDKYFMGNHSYTVMIDLEVKGDKTWNAVWTGADTTDYSNITATVNGNAATVQAKSLNANEKNISVVYKFVEIARGTINNPGVYITTPIAGNTQADIKMVANHRDIDVIEVKWQKDTKSGWQYMPYDEEFEAGADYRVEFMLQINDKDHMKFNVAPTDVKYEVTPGTLVAGYINGKQTHYVAKWDYVLSYTYDIVDVSALEIGSVSFTGVTAPTEGQHPTFTAPTPENSTYSVVTDEQITGGAEYGFINGVVWGVNGSTMDENAVFESGKEYTLSFLIKSDAQHEFAEWLEACADVGYVEAQTVPGDPSLANVIIYFPPCDGGTMQEVSIGGVSEPETGKTPDYDFIYGMGFGRGSVEGDIVWIDVESGEALLPTDTFEFGKEYKLVVIIKADKVDGGKFAFASHDSLTVNINGKKADSVAVYEANAEDGWAQVSMTFTCTEATITNINFTVDSPKEADAPAKQMTFDPTLVTVEGISWVDESAGAALGEDAKFEGAKTYNLTFIITAREGYLIDAEKTEFTVNGQIAYCPLNDGKSFVIVYGFLSDELPYYSVNFVAGEGTMSESMDPIMSKEGTVAIPECKFTAPAGKTFSHWEDGNGNKYLTEIYLNSNVDLTAIYIDDGAHEHVFGDTFTDCDETMHWKTCLYGDECPDITSGTAEQGIHNYDSDCDDRCNDCGYVRENAGVIDGVVIPLHFFELACDETCGNCGFTREVTHTPGSSATCVDDQECTVCHKILAEASGVHTPGAEPTCTEAQKCTVCGAEITAANGHTAGVEWICDENGHHKVCPCGEKLDAGEHTDADGDKKCDACDYDMKTGLGSGATVLIILGAAAVIGGGFCLYWFVFRKKKTEE